MKIMINPKEKGQVLVILVLVFLGFFAMLALVIDGGAAYTARRRAQNAADAGALAGADSLCRLENSADPETRAETVALDYAINKNGAAVASALADQDNGLVTVDATVQTNSFFAGLIGVNQISANATARAKCFPVCSGNTVMPIAWACKPPAEGGGSADCAIDFGEDTSAIPGDPDDPGDLYIAMDTESTNTDFYCQDPPNSGLPKNTLDCDLNNDGVNDVLANGNRSWLDIDGGANGASDMSTWIATGQSPLLKVETWVPGAPGGKGSVFDAAQTRIGDIVAIPVFDKYCDGWPDAACATTDKDDFVVDGGGASSLYFHVIALAPFKITCVTQSKTTTCPGHILMDTANPDLEKKNIKTIEGYFLRGYVPGLTKCDAGTVDPSYTGVYTIHLVP